MKTARKVMLLAMCAVLLVCATIAGTVAYLQSTTGVVKNTMSVGKVQITLDEAPVDVYGKAIEGDRCTENDYKLIPGHNYLKDPTVHVVAGSEESYIFVQVINPIATIEADITIEAQMIANGWDKLGDGYENIWVYNTTVDARNGAVDKVVFKEFTIKGDAAVESYDKMVIQIKAFAIQKDGFDSAEAAWNAANFELIP